MDTLKSMLADKDFLIDMGIRLGTIAVAVAAFVIVLIAQ